MARNLSEDVRNTGLADIEGTRRRKKGVIFLDNLGEEEIRKSIEVANLYDINLVYTIMSDDDLNFEVTRG